MAVVTDQKVAISLDNSTVAYFVADVISATDYYAFGSPVPGRSFSLSSYRYGFNGMERDNEISGAGSSYYTEFRQYDPRLGRWFSVDPILQPWMSPFCAMDNNPISFVDPFGLQASGGGSKMVSKQTRWSHKKRKESKDDRGKFKKPSDRDLKNAEKRKDKIGGTNDFQLNDNNIVRRTVLDIHADCRLEELEYEKRMVELKNQNTELKDRVINQYKYISLQLEESICQSSEDKIANSQMSNSLSDRTIAEIAANFLDQGIGYKWEGGNLRTDKTPEGLEYMDCAEFVSRVLDQAGHKNKDGSMLYQNVPALRKYFEDEGWQKSDSPIIGDITIWEGHTGIVVDIIGERLVIIHSTGIPSGSKGKGQGPQKAVTTISSVVNTTNWGGKFKGFFRKSSDK